jgi:hypothetical protein
MALDSLRPWMAHAFRDRVAAAPRRQSGILEPIAVSPLHKATVIVDASGRVLFRTAGSAQLFMMLSGAMEQIERNHGMRDIETPVALQRVVRELVGAAAGEGSAPPRTRIKTVWGTIYLEAVWLAPAGATAADIVANRDAA